MYKSDFSEFVGRSFAFRKKSGGEDFIEGNFIVGVSGVHGHPDDLMIWGADREGVIFSINFFDYDIKIKSLRRKV